MRVFPVSALKRLPPCKVVRGPLLLVFLVLLGLPVAAQSPDAGSVSVSVTPEEVVASVEEPATFDIVVGFTSENPLDGQQTRRVDVEVTGTPAGWSVVLDRSRVDLSPGGSATVTATVSINVNAEADDADLVVTATLYPRGLNDVPGVGTTVDPADTADASVTVLREDPLTREFVEAVGGWLWILLGAGVVLAIVAAKLVFDTRRTAVKLHAKTTEVAVEAGGRVAVPLRVENLTRSEDTVVFHVAPMPDGWSAHLPVPELDLDGQQSEELHLIIQAPTDAPPDAREVVGVSAHSAQAPKRVAELVITAVVQDGHPYAKA